MRRRLSVLHVVVHAEEVNGVRWQSVTSDSNDGRCLEMEARSVSSGEPLGLVGGCGLAGVVFERGEGFRSSRGEMVLVPVVGTLRTPSAAGSVINTVVFGVSSCICDVRVTFADGTSIVRRSAKGIFFVYRPGTPPVQRVEAIDDAGAVLAAQAMPDGRERLDSRPAR